MARMWMFAVGTFALAQSIFSPSNPPLTTFTTYLGPDAYPYQIVADASGNVYVSGFTQSADFACTLPAPATGTSPVWFIIKFQSDGRAVPWTACFSNRIGAIALDPAGSPYAAIDSTGSALIEINPSTGATMSSYSIPSASIVALAFDSAGNIYLAGGATSGFATTPGSAYPTFSAACGDSAECGFVEKLTPSQNAALSFTVQYATYIGTSAPGWIAVDSTGALWATGTSSVVLTNYSGISQTSTSGFVFKLNSSGSQFVVATSLGGGLIDQIAAQATTLGITVDANGFAYQIGESDCGSILNIVTPGTLPYPGCDPESAGSLPYVRKFDPSGKTVYASFLPNVSGLGYSIAVDSSGNAYISSYNSSPQLIVLNSDASQIVESIPLPGYTNGTFIDSKNALYLTGDTRASPVFFLATPGAYITQPPVPDLYYSWAQKLDFSQPAALSMSCLVNAASFWSGRNTSGPDGAVAPGEIVTAFGNFPAGPDVTLTFDGHPAPILYAGSTQINAVVPFEIAGPNTTVVIANGTQTSGPYQLPVDAASPGVFTLSGSGPTSSAAINEDGTINSPTNPAAPGSIISVYVTGAGAYTTMVPDGSLGGTNPPFAVPALGVSAAIGVTPALVLFVGQAPGLIAGAVQVNLQIPADAKPGSNELFIGVGDYSTPSVNVFIASPPVSN